MTLFNVVLFELPRAAGKQIMHLLVPIFEKKLILILVTAESLLQDAIM